MADMRVRGAKAGQKEPRKPNISKDTVASVSTAKLLYGLAEGEVYGLADGAKSIRLDGTPLVDDAGNPNFDGVTWDFRNGSNYQEYVKGFPDVSNETPINVELRSSQPWIKAFNDTQISAVRVRFKWNRLSQTNSENGDVTGHKIDYAIDLQTDGGAYQTILTTKIHDKTSAGYERTHRIDLPKAKTGWQLRVRRITPNSTSDLIQDTMMIDAVAEVIDVKLSYPNTALLGVQYNAEIFSNIAKMSVRLKGKIIRVPDNYDPISRTYTGIWTGNFKDAYSNNPAWIFYDLCTQWRGGLGERLDATMIDRWSLYALGQYCDQPVSDGQGGLEPRFTCNVYLQKQEEAYTVLQNIAGIFRAMSFWTGEKIFVDADVPQDSIYTYSSANIVGGVAGIQYSGTRNRDRHTLAKVAWDNPNNDYQTEYEYVRDEKAMSKFGVKVLDLSAFGCTSQAQAQRAGLWALKTEQLETRQVTFSVGLDGAIPTVGNIISLSDEAFAGRANGGRVSTVNSTQRIIELDREVTASVGDVLIINGGSGKSERRNISNVVGNRITVTAAFTSAEPQHVWAIETADLKLMRFRVMSITENDDATYTIAGMQHEPQKYDAIDFGTDVKPTDITIINPDTVDAPDTVNIESRHREVQGQTVTTLVIGWSQVKGAVAYDVEWRKDDGTWIKLPRTGNVSVEIDGVYSGNYMARVRAISAFDVQSNPTTSILTEVKGKIGLPPTVVGLTATGVLFGMDLKWGFAAGSGDAAYTEIQVGSAPNVNVATLGQYSYPTNSHTINGLQGNLSQSYRARLVDKLGFKSDWTAWVTGTTDASADKIMDLIQGEINESSLNQALTSKIEKIETNSSSIGVINTELDKAKADIAAADKVIAANKTEAANAVAAANAGLATAKTDISTAKADIVEAKRVADLAKTDSAANKTTIASLATTVGNNKTSVDSSITTLTNKDLALSNLYTALKSEYDTNKASVSQDLTTLTNKDISLSSLLTALDTDYKGNKTAIRNELTAVSNKANSTATSLTSLTTEVGKNKTAISTEATTRSTEDTALSNRITTVSGRTDNALSRITTAETTIANNTGAITQQKTDITAEYKQAIDDIEIGGRNYFPSRFLGNVENWTRGTYSTANKILELEPNTVYTFKIGKLNTFSNQIVFNVIDATDADHKYGQANRRILSSIFNIRNNTEPRKDIVNEFTTPLSGKVTFDVYGMLFADPMIMAEVQIYKGNKATDWTPAPEDVEADYNAKISTESTARADADKTITSSVTTLKSDYDANKASVTSSLSTLTTKDTALTNSLNALTSRVGTAESTITSNNTALVNKDTALTNSLNALTTDYNGNKTAIRNELTAVSNKTNSTATSLGTLTTTVGNNTTKISQESTARSTADTALGKRITDTDAIAKNAQSRVGTAETAISNANSAIATTKTDLTAAYKKAIDEIEIGGRNLLENSNRSVFSGNTSRAEYTLWGVIQDDLEKAPVGSDITISFDVVMAKGLFLNVYCSNTLGATGFSPYQSFSNIGTNKQRLSFVTKVVKGSTPSRKTQLEFYSNYGSEDWYTISNVKIEKGNKATDWTPAPEDVEKVIADNKADIEQKLTVVSTAQSSTAQSVTGLTAKTATAQTTADQAKTAAATAQTKADTADTKATTATSNIATMKTELTATTGKANAATSAISTLSTTVNGHTTSIQTAQSSINGLEGKYSVRIDAGGRVSGFGLASNTTRSDFAVVADYFWIAPPTGSAKGTKPFMVLTAAKTINGTSVPAGTYIESAYIHNGSIDTAKIKDLSVSTAKIANLAVKTAQIDNLAVSTAKIALLAVKSAQIDNLAVTSGKIANLAVETLKIADNAVTVPITIEGAGSVYVNTGYTEVMKATIDTDLGYVTAHINCSVVATLTGLFRPEIGIQSAEANIYAAIYVDGVAIESETLVYSASPTLIVSGSGGKGKPYPAGGTIGLVRMFAKSASKKTLSFRLRVVVGTLPSSTSMNVISLHNKMLAISTRK